MSWFKELGKNHREHAAGEDPKPPQGEESCAERRSGSARSAHPANRTCRSTAPRGALPASAHESNRNCLPR